MAASDGPKTEAFKRTLVVLLATVLSSVLLLSGSGKVERECVYRMCAAVEKGESDGVGFVCQDQGGAISAEPWKIGLVFNIVAMNETFF